MQAESALQRALQIRERILEPEHPVIAESLHDLAFIYYCQGHYIRAESLFQRALAIREQGLGRDHDSLAYTLDNLAVVYTELGKYEHWLFVNEAWGTSITMSRRRSLAIREQFVGLEHPHLASSLNTLAEIYLVQCKYAQAEPLFEQVLSTRERTLRPEHPHVTEILEYQADLLRKTNKEAEARVVEARAKTIRSRHAQEAMLQ